MVMNENQCFVFIVDSALINQLVSYQKIRSLIFDSKFKYAIISLSFITQETLPEDVYEKSSKVLNKLISSRIDTLVSLSRDYIFAFIQFLKKSFVSLSNKMWNPLIKIWTGFVCSVYTYIYASTYVRIL